jgi:transcriptional regulator with XRE-family HTH domain
MNKAKDGRWDSKFGKFVSAFGTTELARRLGVNPSAVTHWLRGYCSPHPANAIKIQTLAKQRGVALTLDEIYEHFREVRSERYTPSSLKPEPARV